MTTEIKLEIDTCRNYKKIEKIIQDVSDLLKEYFDKNIDKETESVKAIIHYSYRF